MVEMQGVAPLRCLTGGSAAITPLAKKCPLDIFLNAPFNSLFNSYDKIKTQTIGLSFYFMVEMQGVEPLRCLTGGSAAITPLAKKCPLDIFLNAPFNSLFDLYDKIKTQTIGLSFYFMVEMQGVEPWSKKRNLTPSPCASLFLFFTLNFKQTKSFNASQIYVCAMRFDIALHSPIFF